MVELGSRCVPSLLARDLGETLRFYESLGFRVTGRWPDGDMAVWAEVVVSAVVSMAALATVVAAPAAVVMVVGGVLASVTEGAVRVVAVTGAVVPVVDATAAGGSIKSTRCPIQLVMTWPSKRWCAEQPGWSGATKISSGSSVSEAGFRPPTKAETQYEPHSRHECRSWQR